jgi:hypothetical protein
MNRFRGLLVIPVSIFLLSAFKVLKASSTLHCAASRYMGASESCRRINTKIDTGALLPFGRKRESSNLCGRKL